MPSRKGRTTIWCTKETKEALKKSGVMGDNYDTILRRLLSGEGNLWLEVLAVDGKPPGDHSVLLQLGNAPARFYFFQKGAFKEVPMDALSTMILEDVQPEK